MIVVTIDYRPDLECTLDASDVFDDWVLSELRDSSERITGQIFSEDIDRVDVRMRPFGRYDEFSEPLFITVDIEDSEMRGHTSASLCEKFIAHFGTHLKTILDEDIPFRVWVRRITGSTVGRQGVR